MNKPEQWLINFYSGDAVVDGLVAVKGYDKAGQPPEEVAVMEKAAHYEADAVFFEASQDNKPQVPQAFIYCADSSADDSEFGQKHKQLWSWGGVPLVYRVSSGLLQLFRCAHRPDFEKNGQIVFRPFKQLRLASQIAADPWWDKERLRNGTLWDDPEVCKTLLSSNLAAQKTLIKAVKELYEELDAKSILKRPLRRRLLILSVLIAYLEARRVFEDGFFARFLPGADKFFHVLADGPALLALLEHLEERFNGHIFVLTDSERETLLNSTKLALFARLVEGRQEASGQRTLWQRYSFADLPVELISHVYQLFVEDVSVAVYTPHFVVRLMLGEILSWERLDRLQDNDEVIMDGACGSGIFLVEAYKRLVLHWRFRNNWKRPGQRVLKGLLKKRLRGIDLEEGAVELAAFSLCLALCDALEPMEIRTSVRLFPELKEKTIHTGCFFESREKGTIKDKIGVAVGNPPFSSTLTTDGAKRAYKRYQDSHGALPDKQLAYLFLHESMEMLVSGGVLSMLQAYNFLYNQWASGFRKSFFERWDVREILDFISIRGLFHKGGADTKVVVVVAEAQIPPGDRKVLHATFRRSGRADAEQGFDIDYYDMHWLSRQLILDSDDVWRTNLVGGGRVLSFVDQLRKLQTLGQFAKDNAWEKGEGFIFGNASDKRPADHVVGQPFLPEDFLTENGINKRGISAAPDRSYQWPRRKEIYSPPIIVIRENMDLHHDLWTDTVLTYSSQIFGFGLPRKDLSLARTMVERLTKTKDILRAFVASSSLRLFCQRSTAISATDILDLPLLPNDHKLTFHETILVRDIVDYYRDLVRLGEDSLAMKEPGVPMLSEFNQIFGSRINAVYKENNLRPLEPQIWPGVICQPYVFGDGAVDWTGADQLRGKIDALLIEKQGGGIDITRIARIYDGACIYLLKPDRLRYWLKSIALRDSDEVLADLAEQGF